MNNLFNIIQESCKIGKNFQIGNFCTIEDSVIIGNNVKIENYVLLKKGTIVGDDCFIDSYVRSSGENQIGHRVILRYGVTIAKNVIIGDDVFIAPNVMTVYGDKQTVIKDNVCIYTSSIIDAGILIEDGVVIGANSFVNKNCIEKGLYIGNPAKKVK